MPTKTALTRKVALARSHKILNRTLQSFRASPSSAARSAVEHAMDAVQRAHRLADDSQHGHDDVRRWEDAWLAAHLGLHAIANFGSET